MTDTHQLTRFVDAQKQVYDSVVQELQNGRKRGHWMWYVFPQIAGLGVSPTSQRYAIRSAEESRAYYAHPVLGSRLRECTQLVMNVRSRSSEDIFGPIDNLKFRSSMTLFDSVTDDGLFRDALSKYFGGEPDQRTLSILNAAAG